MISKGKTLTMKPLGYLLLLAVTSCGGSSDGGTPNSTPSATATGSSLANGTSYDNVIDNDLSSYWAPAGATGSVSITWPAQQNISSVTITEAANYQGHIGAWQLINQDSSNTTVGVNAKASSDSVIMSGSGAGTINISTIKTNSLTFEILSSTGVATVADFKVSSSGSTPSSEPTLTFSGKTAGPSVTLNWTARSIEVTNQKVYRDTDATFEGSSAIQSNIDNVSYSDKNLADGSYYYWLGVTDKAGTEHLSTAYHATIDSSTINACHDLVTNADVNWDESSLSEQEKVECLSSSLGKPVGYGSKAVGGYDVGGNSNLVVIKKPTDGSLVEKQILNAISSDAYNWIVFDKDDFKADTNIAMYRLACEEPAVLSALDNASKAECLDAELWCTNHDVSSSDCDNTFFNIKLNVDNSNVKSALAVPMIHSNTTIDGRGANANFKYSGFEIGNGDDTPSENVIISNVHFVGGGHTEDHEADPDMIRSTGQSHDIWLHQNTFDHTGDSAFDVKQGAYNITVSFNKLKNVKRAALHGSSDSRPVNANIRTTIHNNLFVTDDASYAASEFNTGRRVPLLRWGQSHMFNNVFYGYRKDVLSVRKAGSILFENNMFLNNTNNAKKDDIDYWVKSIIGTKLVYDDGSSLEVSGTKVYESNANCQAQGSGSSLDGSSVLIGNVPDMLARYDAASQSTINVNMMATSQDLADYVYATAGKGGLSPYVANDALSAAEIIKLAPDTCQ
ncbi:pectate lyase family protein [Agarivorans sp. QJM3NY_33]|uniref:pectate lyase family protein n=1 Tax=Agarivorans sp. QJM3NY_33 TaxID=3421432 RepID=UPI003D7D1F8A